MAKFIAMTSEHGDIGRLGIFDDIDKAKGCLGDWLAQWNAETDETLGWVQKVEYVIDPCAATDSYDPERVEFLHLKAKFEPA